VRIRDLFSALKLANNNAGMDTVLLRKIHDLEVRVVRGNAIYKAP
jgi:hypothetical protein